MGAHSAAELIAARLEIANQRIAELEEKLTSFEPRPHWSEESQSLVRRLRGIYGMGPNADKNGVTPEFGYRTFSGLPPIQAEAAARIEELEAELATALKQRDYCEVVATKQIEFREEAETKLEAQLAAAKATIEVMRRALESALQSSSSKSGGPCGCGACLQARAALSAPGVQAVAQEIADLRAYAKLWWQVCQERDALRARAEQAETEIERLKETYTDDEGTVWTVPTAWAYAQACKALHKHEAERDAALAKLAQAREALAKARKELASWDPSEQIETTIAAIEQIDAALAATDAEPTREDHD